MRPIDADELYPDCLTKEGTLAISQSQIANAPIVDVKNLTDMEIKFNGRVIGYMTEDGAKYWKEALMRSTEPNAKIVYEYEKEGNDDVYKSGRNYL